MLRIHRFSPLLLGFVVVGLLPQLACTLITDVDRSKIPAPPVIAPDPEPADAGRGGEEPDADMGMTFDAGADATADAGGDAAPTEPELDAGPMGTEEPADGG